MIVIQPDGTESISRRDVAPSLKELQAIVGGYIELIIDAAIWQGQPAQVYCNEEGALIKLAPNLLATVYVKTCFKPLGRILAGDMIHGPVVILVGSARAV
jgi:hypothetical protein